MRGNCVEVEVEVEEVEVKVVDGGREGGGRGGVGGKV